MKKRIMFLIVKTIFIVITTILWILNKKEEYYVLFDVPHWKNTEIVTNKQKNEFENYLKDTLDVKVNKFSTYSPGVYVKLTKSEYRYLVKHYEKVDYIYPTNVQPGLP